MSEIDELRERVAQACRVLGISYHTLQSYLRYPVFDEVPAAPEDTAVTVALEA